MTLVFESSSYHKSVLKNASTPTYSQHIGSRETIPFLPGLKIIMLRALLNVKFSCLNRIMEIFCSGSSCRFCIVWGIFSLLCSLTHHKHFIAVMVLLHNVIRLEKLRDETSQSNVLHARDVLHQCTSHVLVRPCFKTSPLQNVTAKYVKT